jgi:hypothetical protein
MGNLKIAGMILVIGISVGFISCNNLPIIGNGILKTSERNVSSFEKIRSSGSADLRLHLSQEYRVIITTDSNLIEIVTTEVSGNTLRIGSKNGNYSFTKIQVDVYCPVLTGISISGSGSFSSDDKITAAVFESNVSGSGNINGTVECDNFSADISGSGDIAIAGTGKNSNIRISGSGNFNGIEFITNNVTARISGSGNMSIWALENINATVSGSGSIKYRGTPKIDFNGSGSGKIRSE